MGFSNYSYFQFYEGYTCDTLMTQQIQIIVFPSALLFSSLLKLQFYL